MAEGPDPNRNFDTDREINRDELNGGYGMGDPASSRAGLSSGAIAAIAVVLAAVVLALMFL